MRNIILIIFILLQYHLCIATAQTRVSIRADDGLEVAADSYLVNDTLPWVLMFHQAGSSRGEFREIAPKLTKLGYNGLAVDLRYGNEIRFIPNETAQTARTEGYSRSMTDAMTDMRAAINWVSQISHLPVILFGSSYTASLSMMMAVENTEISAVIAFSPGEYLGENRTVQDQVMDIQVPVFIASTNLEFPYVTELSSGIDPAYKTLFTPANNSGSHGAKALWESEEASNDYWLNLLMFLNRIR